MSSYRVPLEEILSSEEYRAIDAFCEGRRGPDALADIARFLASSFGVSIDLDQDIVAGYATDSSNLPGYASALARPASVRECAVLLRACSSSWIPVTLSAGRSNLTGSATSASGLVISLSAMQNPKVNVDPAARTVTSPVGIILEDMRKAVLEQTRGKLLFPVDPTSRLDAMVGGALSCNASGFMPGERGSMRPWVCAIGFLLMNGLQVRADRGRYVSENGRFVLVHGPDETPVPVPNYPRPSIKNASGPYSNPEGRVDLVDLFVGSEGIFGLITDCSLALSGHPGEYLDLFISLPDETDALGLLSYLSGDRPGPFSTLTAFEYFGPNCRRYMDHEQRLFRADDTVGVYLQVPLTDQSMDDLAVLWLDILREAPCRIRDDAIMILLSESDRRIFFEARHSMPANSLEVVKRRGTHTIMTDTVVPLERFAEFLEFTHGLIRYEGLDYLVFGHLGDCHLHFNILPQRDQLAKALDVYDRIIEASANFGGVYSGEHGTGKRKRGDFLKCYGSGAAAQVLATKRALDPHLLLNRGNVVECPGGEPEE